MTVTLHHGDCLEVMAGMEAGSVDAVVTDPPYGLGFMGKAWDGIPPGPETAAAMLRVLAPSHYLLAFGGTRTWHRLACALEDAGFEIRDTLMWLYGSGFPKGRACLKPAWEPVILARKPGPMLALNVDGCRVGHSDDLSRYDRSATSGMGYGGVDKPTLTPAHPAGRWPANLLLDEESARLLDEQTGELTSGSRAAGDYGRLGYQGWGAGPMPAVSGDSGGASRFFYCSKASRRERGEGNGHPTVKPLDLMRYLCRLVTPPGGTVLDPFTGSGSTGCAAVLEGFDFIGIEMDAEYVEIARRRIEAAAAASSSASN